MTRNMDTIRGVKTDDNGWFTTGEFDSKTFLPGKTGVLIFTDDGATLEDAERCINHLNGLAGKPELIDAIEKGLEQFFCYMYDEWAAMGIYDRIVDSCKDVMEKHDKGSRMSAFLSRPTLCVYPQKNGDVGYGIECDCPWEPEHQCLILIKNDECVYVGPSEMLDPWSDKEDLHCVWNDEWRSIPEA